MQLNSKNLFRNVNRYHKFNDFKIVGHSPAFLTLLLKLRTRSSDHSVFDKTDYCSSRSNKNLCKSKNLIKGRTCINFKVGDKVLLKSHISSSKQKGCLLNLFPRGMDFALWSKWLLLLPTYWWPIMKTINPVLLQRRITSPEGNVKWINYSDHPFIAPTAEVH